MLAAASWAVACHHTIVVTPQSENVVTVRGVGLSQPENLVYDSVADVYLVDNMGAGDPAARDDNGFISRVAPDGRVVALRWIAGGSNGVRLDAPKGIALRGDTIAVADVGSVHLFDRRTGAPLRTNDVPGLVLNDVASASDGALWITDTGPDRGKTPIDTSKDMDAVWRTDPDGRVRAVARGLALSRPDGIVIDAAGALVTTFGANRIEQVGSRTGTAATAYAVLPGGRVDGLRRLRDGSLVTSSWDARTVWELGADRSPRALLTDVQSPAGIAIDTRRHRLAVTSMQANTMYLLPLDR
jgi:sugar lactone lactonase YvrE